MTEKKILQRGLWFEEFEEGVTYLHRPGRTVTEADNTLFTTQTMNTQPLHLDAAWAAEQPGFRGERLVNSMFTLSTVVGLSVSQLTLGTIVANLGFTEVKFPAPMFHGDTLYVETTCIAKRKSKSRPNQGIVELKHIGRNQDGTIVCEATRSTMMQCRADAESSDAAIGGETGSPAHTGSAGSSPAYTEPAPGSPAHTGSAGSGPAHTDPATGGPAHTGSAGSGPAHVAEINNGERRS
ncbi:MaoC/PaaZ C-terminal domain-containing protein [Corynebacterium sp. HMSC28B08]|uniref:MaoC family dehydratase n=1 Tax=Corynebacterium sp. HMSC28B08 TaxID=1581066 RepID=UPI0009F16CB4